MRFSWKPPLSGALAVVVLCFVACGHDAPPASSSVAAATASSEQPTPRVSPADAAPPATQTGGFDGAAAYDFTAKLVSFGPRPPGSDAIHKTQAYIIDQLKSFGCAVDTDDFNAETPIGSLQMKNIVAKVPGTGDGIILLLTHYDTLRLPDFVGAEDAGSSSGLMLEMAKLLCAAPKQRISVWIAFLDGEEAQVVENGQAQWTDTDSVYGSRELSARLALSGDLKRVRAVILADMVGQKDLVVSRDSNSTKWLVDLVWSTAARLGYKDIFVSRPSSVEDDHQPFTRRSVPAVDIIDLDGYAGYWHTPQDTMDKLSPRSLAIVGHVILASVAELQKR